MTYVVSERAEHDLNEIVAYIAADNPDAAIRLFELMRSRFELLAQHPRMGRSRPDIAPGLRSLTIGNYLVFHRIEKATVQIVRVVHSARNLTDLKYD